MGALSPKTVAYVGSIRGLLHTNSDYGTHGDESHLRTRHRVPTGMNVSVGSVSGHVELVGRFGSVKASSVSGHVTIGDTNGDADIRSISGHIEVGDCGGRCRANTKSGHILASHVASELKGHTMSGNVEVGVGGLGDVEVSQSPGVLS